VITYAYWAVLILLVLGVMGGLGGKLGKWGPASGLAVTILVIGFSYYYFYLQQVMVKHWGGVMSISVPEGQEHLSATWKDDNLWVENYDPTTNTCYFTEYSRGNLLEGKVVIKNCNPLVR
jgi:hypothetical protein